MQLNSRFMRSTKFATVAAALFVAGCASASMAHADPTTLPGPTPPPGPKTTIDSDGTYTVGTDIAPGTYSSAGPVGDGTCYWKRVNGSDLLDNALSKKAQVVTIEATDTVFKTNGCQPWQLTDCLPGCAPPAANPIDVLGQIGRLFGPH
ncbi:hypothetical protein ACVWWN_004674 [Mycobacterium sp. URHB0021]|jgi:hypothetical protein